MIFRRKHPALLRQVLVVCGDTAIRGVLYHVSGPYLVLRDAMIIERGAEPAKADGELIVKETRVDYVQALGGGSE